MIQYKKRYSMIFNETTIPQNTWMLAIIGKAKAVEIIRKKKENEWPIL